MSVGLKTNKIEIRESGVVAEYELWHSTPGAEGTTLSVNLTMANCFSRVKLRADFGELVASTPDEAFDKMASWFERAAKALKERKEPVAKIPVFSD